MNKEAFSWFFAANFQHSLYYPNDSPLLHQSPTKEGIQALKNNKKCFEITYPYSIYLTSRLGDFLHSQKRATEKFMEKNLRSITVDIPIN